MNEWCTTKNAQIYFRTADAFQHIQAIRATGNPFPAIVVKCNFCQGWHIQETTSLVGAMGAAHPAELLPPAPAIVKTEPAPTVTTPAAPSLAELLTTSPQVLASRLDTLEAKVTALHKAFNKLLESLTTYFKTANAAAANEVQGTTECGQPTAGVERKP